MSFFTTSPHVNLVCVCTSLHMPTHRALKQAVRGCGSSFQPFITSELLELLFSTLEHTNRFVRETGFKLIAAIVKVPGEGGAVSVTLICVLHVVSDIVYCMWFTAKCTSVSRIRHFLRFIQKHTSLCESSQVRHLSLPPQISLQPPLRLTGQWWLRLWPRDWQTTGVR